MASALDAGLFRFVVGQDPAGAADIHGRAGGLFRSRKDALADAGEETGHRPRRAGPRPRQIKLP